MPELVSIHTLLSTTVLLQDQAVSQSFWQITQDLFFSLERPFALVLNSVIIALAVVALIMVLKVVVVSLPRERKDLNKLSDLSELSRTGVEQTLTGSSSTLSARLRDLQTFHSRKHPVDEAMLTALSTASFRRELAPASGIARSLVLLGLLGTLWGLGVAVTELATTLSRTAGMPAQDLAQAILQTLGGLQIAFGTTLMGILGALVVGFAVGAARLGQGSVLDELERVVSTELVPLYDSSEASLLADVAASLEHVQRQLGEDIERIVEEVRTHGKQLGEDLRREFDQIEESFRQRAEQLIGATGRALEGTLAIIGERKEGEPTLAEYVRTVRASTQELERSVESAGRLIPGLEERLTGTIEKLRNGLEDALATHAKRTAEVAERQIEASTRLLDVAKEQSTREASLDETLARLSDALDAAAASWKRTDELIEEIGSSCHDAIRTGLRDFVDQLKDDRAGPQEDRERVLQALTRFEDLLSGHLQRIRTDRQETLGQLEELSTIIRETLRTSLLEVGGKLDARNEDVGRTLIQGVENLGRELRDLSRRSQLLPDGRGSGAGRGTMGPHPWLPRNRSSGELDSGSPAPEAGSGEER